MKPEQEALLKKAIESIESSKLLLNNGYNDFAASRAYYSMYYVTEAFLLEEDLSFSKHSGAISAFGKYFTKTGKVPREYHRYLIEAQESRNIGDYGTSYSLTTEKVSEIIEHAEEFINLAKNSL